MNHKNNILLSNLIDIILNKSFSSQENILNE